MTTWPVGARTGRYHPLMRALHWTIALLVLIVLPVGILIKFVAEADKPVFYLIHESLGFLILWIMLARLAVRLAIGAPPREEPVPAFRALATTVHVSLYAALILQPIFGFLATNAFGFPLQWFGVVTVPSPIGDSPELAPYLMGVHVALGYAILVLFCLHMAGVIYHTFVRRDGLLRRMI